MPEKVIVVGDKICLLATDEKVITYNISNAGISISESGSYTVGFWLKEEQQEVFYPEFYILDLFRDGYVWKEGQEDLAAKIRNIRIKSLLHLMCKPSKGASSDSTY